MAERIYPKVDLATYPASTKETIQTNESCTSMAYTNLITPGPTVTLTTGTKALVIISAEFAVGDYYFDTPYASFAVSGATTIAASDANAVASLLVDPGGSSTGHTTLRASAGTLVDLTSGSNTFQMKYRSSDGFSDWHFSNRTIVVINLA